MAIQMTVTSEMLRVFLDTLKFTVSLFEEEDGTYTGTIEELDLIENASSKENCLISLPDFSIRSHEGVCS